MAETKLDVNGCTIVGRHQPASEKYPKDLDVFYRIPYAEASRFQLAKILEPRPASTIIATDPGSISESPLETLSAPESPLHLHIIRPSGQSSSATLIPVVVYFHGGGFNFGNPLTRDHVSFVSWAGDEIMVVAVEFRLGVLGFGPGEEVGGELNVGLKDQRLAVEWVMRWIERFGGDARRMTLMGISAGAHSVGHHMLSPEPLPFQRAILESGAPTARCVLSSTHPRILSQNLAFMTQARGRSFSSVAVSSIRSFGLSVWAANMATLIWPFQPVVEPATASSAVIPDTPLKLWARRISEGRGRDVTVLTGFCSDEGVDFVPQGKNTNEEFLLFFKTLIPSLTDDDLSTLERLYPDPTTNDSSPYKMEAGAGAAAAAKGKQFLRLSDAYAHYAYMCPILHTADTLSRAGATVYLYEFAALSKPHRAASHCCHAPAATHDSALAGWPGMIEVAEAMTKRWGRFIAGGDMAAKAEVGEPWWPAFKGGLEEGEILVFGRGNDEMTGGVARGEAVGKRRGGDREKEVCRFWWERMGLSQGMGEAR